jgi:hypothetical protein
MYLVSLSSQPTKKKQKDRTDDNLKNQSKFCTITNLAVMSRVCLNIGKHKVIQRLRRQRGYLLRPTRFFTGVAAMQLHLLYITLYDYHICIRASSNLYFLCVFAFVIIFYGMRIFLRFQQSCSN